MTISGGLGPDYLHGGDGFDYLRFDEADYPGFTVSFTDFSRNTGPAAGDSYDHTEGLILSGGDDNAFGDSGANWIYGLAGHDNLWGALGADYLHGGDGFDYARYDDASYGNLVVSLGAPAQNTGAAAGDVFVSIEGLILGAGNDHIHGDGGANWLYGQRGHDNLWGGPAGDHLDGGAGFDYARYDQPGQAGLAADLMNGGGGDVFVKVEGLILTDNPDVGLGDAQSNWLWGMGGNDVLYGRGGQDHLIGGAAGDTFVFDSAPDADVVEDFELGDKIALSRSVFGAADLGGGAERLVVDGAPASGAATLLFNTSLGILSYDADGSGAGFAASIATLFGPGVAGFSSADLYIY